MIPKELLSNLK